MKTKAVILLQVVLLCGTIHAQQILEGRVTGHEGFPLKGANVILQNAGNVTITDSDGAFSLALGYSIDTIVVSFVGYMSKEIPISPIGDNWLDIELLKDPHHIEEVLINTGYYQIPKERATGSFSHIDNKLLNSSVGSDILGRLEGVANSLDFDRRLSSPLYGDNSLSIRVRGLSTLNADNSPLIVLNNFPYEGQLENINPNDIESVTLLKDAAAASIWGAKAANGVIVINTKAGNFNRTVQVDLATNVTLGDFPDLYYNPNFLGSLDFINIERQLFNRGFYDAQEANPQNPPLSPVVELLSGAQAGQISSEEVENELLFLQGLDIRREAASTLYRQPIKRNYGVSFRGGSNISKYYFSAGLDRSNTEQIGDKNSRFTFNGSNSIRLLDRIEVSTNLAFTKYEARHNGIGLADISPTAKEIYPYARLADENNISLSLPRNHSVRYASQAQDWGLLDWLYRPLDELALSDNRRTRGEVRLGGTVRYEWSKLINTEVSFLYQDSKEKHRIVRHWQSYAARHQINRFTQADGTHILPVGGMLDQTDRGQTAYSGRAQLNFRHVSNGRQRLDAILGAEMRHTGSGSNNSTLYGYDDGILTYQSRLDFQTRFQVRPQGTAQLPVPLNMLSGLTDRYISYYGNATYDVDSKYALSISARNDASNLFGVRTNQKWVPLWSLGVGWQISNENFYRSALIPHIKLRATYGYNGNVDKSIAAFTTARYGTNSLTGLPQATVVSPGNPNLRWEKVGVLNFGLDFGFKNDWLSGTIEYYRKHGRDLIGQVPIDRTTGFLASYQINHADILTKGIDIELRTKVYLGEIRWESMILANWVHDNVTSYKGGASSTSTSDLNMPPVEGRPRYRIQSYPWFGLERETGDPLVQMNGALTKNYSEFVGGLKPEDFVYHGPAIPTVYGSIRNSLSWRNLSLSFTIGWKSGYYFRRSTINYNALFDSWTGHKDFYNRWQEEGDELFTDIPSLPDSKIALRDQVYMLSEATVSKGDHIRLRDLSLSYNIATLFPKAFDSMNARLLIYTRNIGILWRANRHDLDPDLPRSNFPMPRETSIGLNIRF